MRKVLYKKWIPKEYIPMNPNVKNIREVKEGTGMYSDFIHEGLFHKWATGFEEFESGLGNYTYAIIETPDGCVEEVLPTNIKFIQ